jgi:SSS family solute:Na+ symporter
MPLSWLIIAVYFLANLAIGAFLFLRRHRTSGGHISGMTPRESGESFFLANRSLGPAALALTLAATNFSAFTVLGLSGAGYREGYAYYPLMGLGTGLMALSFFVIGMPMREAASARGFLTQADFIAARYASPALGKLFSLALLAITLPYLSIQAMSCGKMLEGILGLPYAWGALIVTAAILAYSLMGGMRSVVWTDVFQGILILALCLAALPLIAGAGGGWKLLHASLTKESPLHYRLPGPNGAIGPLELAGFFLLWFLADPCFPQLWQRFIAVKGSRPLHFAASLYPLLCSVLFLCTISIGVLGRAVLPGLEQSASDSILPILLGRYFPPWLGALLGLGGIAALMSTMDSQMLSLSSMIAKDFTPERGASGRAGRMALFALAALSFILALRPPATIFAFLQGLSFNAYASLAPAFIAGLYWKKANLAGAAASLVAGLGASTLFALGVLKTPGLPPVFPIAGASSLALVLGSFMARGRGRRGEGGLDILRLSAFLSPRTLLLSLGIAVLAFLPYLFKTPGPALLGLPAWVWFELGLGIVLSFVFALERRGLRRSGP